MANVKITGVALTGGYLDIQSTSPTSVATLELTLSTATAGDMLILECDAATITGIIIDYTTFETLAQSAFNTNALDIDVPLLFSAQGVTDSVGSFTITKQ